MIKVDYFALTDVGRVRSENQDSYGCADFGNLYFVCDGMGGGAAGDFASRCAERVMTHAFTRLSEKDILAISGDAVHAASPYAARPVAAIRLANRLLFRLADKYSKLAGMGTTVAAILVDTNESVAHIYHVGDSRVYRLRGGVLEQLTKDHTKINELLDEGKMRSDEVRTAEIQSMITRAVGTSETVKIDYTVVAVRPDDCFLLCSDGLNGEIDDASIRSIMIANGTDLEYMAHGLVSAANNAGGKDNTTVVLVRASADQDGTPAPAGRERPVVTFGPENPDQLSYEDAMSKIIMSAAAITVPPSARDTSIFGQPVLLIIVFLAVLLSAGYVVTRRQTVAPTESLPADTARTETGIHLFVLAPLPEQLKLFDAAKGDRIQRLQIVQDWLRSSSRLTQPLENVQISMASGEKEEFRGVSNPAGTPVTAPRGSYWLTLRYPGYVIIDEQAELRETVPVSIEAATAHKLKKIIMIPAQHAGNAGG